MLYTRIYRIVTVSPRDVYHNVFYHVDPDGTIYMVAYDSPDDDLPEESGCVRMRLPLAGMIIKPEGEGKSKVTFMINASLQGSIPNFIMKQAIGV